MDTAILTPFKTAIDGLKRWKLPKFYDVVDRLERFSQMQEAAKILQEIDPGRYAAFLEDGWTLASKNCEDLFSKTYEAINDHGAPLDLDSIEVMTDEYSFPVDLIPAACGFPMGFDEWNDFVENFDSYDENLALYVFVTAFRLSETEVLADASDHYGWDLNQYPNFDNIEELDWVKINKSMKRSGLGCFVNAINVCYYSTGNPYFDYNPYDEWEIAGLPPFSLQGVEELKKQWEAAQPIRADLVIALDTFQNEPHLARKLMRIFLKNAILTKPETPRTRGRTLAEVWGGLPVGETRATDPYGVIG